jgi:hypothetical protein
VLGVNAIDVIPNGTELLLHPGAIFFSGVEGSEACLLIGNRFELQVLGNAIEVGDAGAFDGKWLLAGLPGAVLAHESVSAIP